MPPSRDPHAPNTFRLLTLGSAMLVDSSAVPVGEQRRRLALMVLLAVAGERGVSRDVLVSRLSPESPADSARHALHQLLYYLRKQLGDEAFLGTDPLRLNPEVTSSDLGDFTAALERGALEEAVALYRGPFLDGFHLGDSTEFEEWVEAERARLATRQADALARLAAAADAKGDHDRAIDWWQRLVVLDPLSGRAQIGLMQALAAAGDTAGAVHQAHIHQTRVRAELGVDADAQVADLAARFQRAGRPVAVVTRAPPPPSLETVPSSVLAPPSPHKRPLVIAGLLGAALTIALVAALAPTHRPPTSVVRAGTVMVVPFRIESADSSLAWLSEGMVDLLTIRLSGEGGISPMDPGRVLSAWRRTARNEAGAREELLVRVAGQAGADRVIRGSIVGTPGQVLLSASIHIVADGREVARAMVQGAPDSIPVLIDRLAAQLLGIGTGVEQFRLPSLTSASFPAIRAFLAGRSSLRRGRSEQAVQEFRDAVTLDSTFALAGLELFRSWSATGKEKELGARVAQAGRNRLSGFDRALLDAQLNQFEHGRAVFQIWQAVVNAYPDRPETWYGLGDSYFHWGGLAGLDQPLARAEDAFRRGWELDSTLQAGEPLVVEPLVHLVELAHLRGDTAEVRRLVTYVVRVDSSNERAQALQWHRAAVAGEPELRAYWRALGSGGANTIREIATFLAWTGAGAEDYREAAGRSSLRTRTAGLENASMASAVVAYNHGHPGRAVETADRLGTAGHRGLRDRIRWALWWDGDTKLAERGLPELRRSAEAPLTTGRELRSQFADICTVGLWGVRRGVFGEAQTAADRLRSAPLPGLHDSDSTTGLHYNELCVALLDASQPSGQSRPGATARIAAADSLARQYLFEVCCNENILEANLLLARLWERQGDLPHALLAVRRRSSGFMLAPLLMSTFLREEGRLAQLAGDTAGARRAYRQYLVLRSDPDPALRPQRDSVRAALQRLERSLPGDSSAHN